MDSNSSISKLSTEFCEGDKMCGCLQNDENMRKVQKNSQNW